MLYTKLAMEPRATSVSMLGAPVEQALEAVDEELLVDDHDDAGQQQLDEAHGNVVAVKPVAAGASPTSCVPWRSTSAPAESPARR